MVRGLTVETEGRLQSRSKEALGKKKKKRQVKTKIWNTRKKFVIIINGNGLNPPIKITIMYAHESVFAEYAYKTKGH